MKHDILRLTVITLALTPWIAGAKVAVDPMFTDHIVLQRDMAVPVWGTADPGESVTVIYLSPENGAESSRKAETRAGDDGKWRVDLQPMPANPKGGRLVIGGDGAGDGSVELKDVLVGEVWVGAGQSNMAYGTRHFTEYDPELKKACEGAPSAGLRVFVDGGWRVAEGGSIREFSALLFSFGHALHGELDVPVGLMVGAVNGSPSGSWLTEEMASNNQTLVEMFKQRGGFATFKEMEADRSLKLAEFKEQLKVASPQDRKRLRFSHPGTTLGEHYSKRIRPFVPFAVRGVLWDQGEGGTMIPGVDQYTAMNALIAGWRKAWGQGDFPFLHIQKPSGGGCAWDEGLQTGEKIPLAWQALPAEPLPEDRLCEQNLLHIRMGTIPNAPLVTVSDLTPGVHPRHKYSYGKRACRVALGTVYGRDIVTCGPVYRSHAVRGNGIEVRFQHVGGGLAFRHGEKLQGFEIAGDDLKWEWADAVIVEDKVIVSGGTVGRPLHVRYAFNGREFNWANLFNKDGFPALMFTTAP